jgi:hypothetical protein
VQIEQRAQGTLHLQRVAAPKVKARERDSGC